MALSYAGDSGRGGEQSWQLKPRFRLASLQVRLQQPARAMKALEYVVANACLADRDAQSVPRAYATYDYYYSLLLRQCMVLYHPTTAPVPVLVYALVLRINNTVFY